MNKLTYRPYLINLVGVAIFAFAIGNLIVASNADAEAEVEQISSKQNSSTVEELAPTTINIKAVGDIVAGTNFPDYRLPKNPISLFPQAVQKSLQGADILFGNYESTLTSHPYSTKNVGRGMVFAFRSPPSYSQIFSQVGFDVMSIANNHSMDFGKKGLEDTIANLKNANVTPIGEKDRITYTNVKGIPIAWIGSCFYYYCNTVQDIPNAVKLVKEAQEKAEIVIISMHVGAEGNNAMNVKNRTEIFYGEDRGNSLKFARAMIDAGADLVLGHGPHVPRAMEVYKNKLIAYSLGNFLGYRTFSTTGAKGKSLVLEAKINQNGDFVGGQIIPLKLNSQGIPQVDPKAQTTNLVRKLIKQDFPKTQISINQKGEIVLKDKQATAN